jgi:hypothetical protein
MILLLFLLEARLLRGHGYPTWGGQQELATSCFKGEYEVICTAHVQGWGSCISPRRADPKALKPPDFRRPVEPFVCDRVICRVSHMSLSKVSSTYEVATGVLSYSRLTSFSFLHYELT